MHPLVYQFIKDKKEKLSLSKLKLKLLSKHNMLALYQNSFN